MKLKDSEVACPGSSHIIDGKVIPKHTLKIFSEETGNLLCMEINCPFMYKDAQKLDYWVPDYDILHAKFAE